MATLEERLKFHSGLSIGQTLVRFTLGDRHIDALVDISGRGVVRVLTKPDTGDMYSSWQRLNGSKLTVEGAVVVWGARDPEYMRQFLEEFEGQAVCVPVSSTK